MGQSGNVWEWSESAWDGSNNSADEVRSIRGGDWFLSEDGLRSSSRGDVDPTEGGSGWGFRVASIPEPGTAGILVLSALGAWGVRRIRRMKRGYEG